MASASLTVGRSAMNPRLVRRPELISLPIEITGAGAEGYLDLRRDDVRIGASRHSRPLDTGPRLPLMGVELVLEVDDVREERQRVLAAGWPLAEDPIERPWNMIDFRVVDPSGYYVRITNRG